MPTDSALEAAAGVEYMGGFIVRLTREPGLTKKGVLEKPFFFQSGPMEEIRYTSTSEHTDYNVLARRQLSRPAARQLLQVSFRAIFVDYIPDWATYDHIEFPNNGPADFLTRLRNMQRTMTPIHASMGNPTLVGRWEVDMPMTLRSVEAVETAGEVDARYADVQFVEFDEAEVTVADKGKRRAAEQRRMVVTVYAGGRVEPFSGMAKPPTLAKIAQRVYGATSLWRAIASANGIKGWTANRDLTEYVKKVRGRDFVKLTCPGLA